MNLFKIPLLFETFVKRLLIHLQLQSDVVIMFQSDDIKIYRRHNDDMGGLSVFTLLAAHRSLPVGIQDLNILHSNRTLFMKFDCYLILTIQNWRLRLRNYFASQPFILYFLNMHKNPWHQFESSHGNFFLFFSLNTKSNSTHRYTFLYTVFKRNIDWIW